MNIFTKKGLAIALLFTASSIQFSAKAPDEGMFPLSELSRAGLKAAGLQINEKEIYNPGKVGLVDALVQISGCTGSFVSGKGLIVTNHHCAFSAVQLASTPAQDYLKNGFVAHSFEQEIQAKGLTIRITDSYEDVSEKVLGAVANVMDPIQRINLIKQKREELAAAAQKEDPTIKAEVSEMFIGKTYVLFRYKTIEDVRLVYIPRRDIGEFGGETDNWVWPRHTGDFSFVRAYVAPDGSSAKYSKNNVPYQPKKFLKVNPKGVEENDFVFILGYPGKTFRHRPAAYIEYQQKFLLPYTSELYDFQNKQMELAGKNDQATALALATRIKRNANVLKNYRGKLKGLRNIDLISTKRKEDEDLSAFIKSKSDLQHKYGSLMSDIDNFYKLTFEDAQKELWLNNIYSSTKLLTVARHINAFKDELAKYKSTKDAENFFNLNIENVKQELAVIYESYNKKVDESIGARMFADAYALKGSNIIRSVQNKKFTDREQAEKYMVSLINSSKLNTLGSLNQEVLSSPKHLLAYRDELLDFQKTLEIEVQAFGKEQQRREGALNKLMGDYVAVKEVYQAKNFIPDANSTLRLTYGNIKGYTPVDATYMKPFTTVKGILEKGTDDNPEFEYPEAIRAAWLSKNFGAYEKKDLMDVPVNILYNMDTTGGNSGSPIMNAYGELIGVNFDRSYDATINDFAWNESYSRSIGVDIRYVLWIADKIDNAQFIIKEMGI
jgi:hypothetical protein